VCVSDLIVDARHDDGSKPELSYEDVMGALKSINWHHSPIVVSTR
jgi:hypothetical protein